MLPDIIEFVEDIFSGHLDDGIAEKFFREMHTHYVMHMASVRICFRDKKPVVKFMRTIRVFLILIDPDGRHETSGGRCEITVIYRSSFAVGMDHQEEGGVVAEVDGILCENSFHFPHAVHFIELDHGGFRFVDIYADDALVIVGLGDQIEDMLVIHGHTSAGLGVDLFRSDFQVGIRNILFVGDVDQEL